MALVPFRKVEAPVYNAGLEHFDRFFDRMFGNALTNLADASPSVGGLPLRLDVTETGTTYTIKTDLPGVEQKDVEITLDDGVLTISGEKKRVEETEGETFHRTERTYGSFRRVLALPADASQDGIKARMRNGVLEIEIAKSKAAEKTARRIEIEN